MKILCIGRNYAEHIAELKNEMPDEPVIFSKPDTALLRQNAPFYHPDFSQDIHHEVELILRVSREGKNIQPKFSAELLDGTRLSIGFSGRRLQSKAKAKGLPWTLAKEFNGSAPVSEFKPLTDFQDLNNINFSLNINGELRQKGNSEMMLHKFGDIIAFISKYITLKKGDIIFTGTPAGVGPVKIGDRLEGFIEQEKMFDFEIR